MKSLLIILVVIIGILAVRYFQKNRIKEKPPINNSFLIPLRNRGSQKERHRQQNTCPKKTITGEQYRAAKRTKNESLTLTGEADSKLKPNEKDHRLSEARTAKRFKGRCHKFSESKSYSTYDEASAAASKLKRLTGKTAHPYVCESCGNTHLLTNLTLKRGTGACLGYIDKKVYATYEEAILAVDNVRWQWGTTVRPYNCEFCGKFHLTSQTLVTSRTPVTTQSLGENDQSSCPRHPKSKAYSTFDEANAAVYNLKRRGGRTARPFDCKYCGKYHLAPLSD